MNLFQAFDLSIKSVCSSFFINTLMVLEVQMINITSDIQTYEKYLFMYTNWWMYLMWCLLMWVLHCVLFWVQVSSFKLFLIRKFSFSYYSSLCVFLATVNFYFWLQFVFISFPNSCSLNVSQFTFIPYPSSRLFLIPFHVYFLSQFTFISYHMLHLFIIPVFVNFLPQFNEFMFISYPSSISFC